MRSTASLPSFPGSLSLVEVVPDKYNLLGQKELFDI